MERDGERVLRRTIRRSLAGWGAHALQGAGIGRSAYAVAGPASRAWDAGAVGLRRGAVIGAAALGYPGSLGLAWLFRER